MNTGKGTSLPLIAIRIAAKMNGGKPNMTIPRSLGHPDTVAANSLRAAIVTPVNPRSLIPKRMEDPRVRCHQQFLQP